MFRPHHRDRSMSSSISASSSILGQTPHMATLLMPLERPPRRSRLTAETQISSASTIPCSTSSNTVSASCFGKLVFYGEHSIAHLYIYIWHRFDFHDGLFGAREIKRKSETTRHRFTSTSTIARRVADGHGILSGFKSLFRAIYVSFDFESSIVPV